MPKMISSSSIGIKESKCTSWRAPRKETPHFETRGRRTLHKALKNAITRRWRAIGPAKWRRAKTRSALSSTESGRRERRRSAGEASTKWKRLPETISADTDKTSTKMPCNFNPESLIV